MEKLLADLIKLRAEVAVEALERPADKTAYEYGRVSGLYQGLTKAIEAVQDVLADIEERDE